MHPKNEPPILPRAFGRELRNDARNLPTKTKSAKGQNQHPFPELPRTASRPRNRNLRLSLLNNLLQPSHQRMVHSIRNRAGVKPKPSLRCFFHSSTQKNPRPRKNQRLGIQKILRSQLRGRPLQQRTRKIPQIRPKSLKLRLCLERRRIRRRDQQVPNQLLPRRRQDRSQRTTRSQQRKEPLPSPAKKKQTPKTVQNDPLPRNGHCRTGVLQSGGFHPRLLHQRLQQKIPPPELRQVHQRLLQRNLRNRPVQTGLRVQRGQRQESPTPHPSPQRNRQRRRLAWKLLQFDPQAAQARHAENVHLQSSDLALRVQDDQQEHARQR